MSTLTLKEFLIIYVLQTIFYTCGSMLTPRTTFCKTCNISKQRNPNEGICSYNLYNTVDFLDWESFLDLHHPGFGGSRCDLIDDRVSSRILFIEQKTRDWFCEDHLIPEDKRVIIQIIDPEKALSLKSRFIAQASASLNAKIQHTVAIYKQHSQFTEGRYILSFSKIHSLSWKDKELPDSLIKQFVRNKLLKHSPLSIDGIKIIVDILPCNKILKSNN